MSALPAPVANQDRLLLVSNNELEPILVSAALGRAIGTRLTRLFFPAFGLGRLAQAPVFKQGQTRTLLLDFPTPALAREPEAVRRLLGQAHNLTWLSSHPLDSDERDAAPIVEFQQTDDSLWDLTARSLNCSADLIEPLLSILNEPPDPLPAPERADYSLAWRYALEAARQEPFQLGPSSAGLIDGREPEPLLVFQGYALISEQRELAASGKFHTFDSAAGQGVVVAAPRQSLGYYFDLAAIVRRRLDCALNILTFDSGEPLIVQYAKRPIDLDQRRALLAREFPEHLVRRYGRTGLALKGQGTGSLDVIERVIRILS